MAKLRAVTMHSKIPSSACQRKGESCQAITAESNAKILESSAFPNEVTGGWRVALRLRRADDKKPVELRGFLKSDGKPVSETWSPAPDMHVARYYPAATLLQDGRVLVVGGQDENGVFTARAEIYDPVSGG